MSLSLTTAIWIPLGIGWNLLLAIIPCILVYELSHWVRGRTWQKSAPSARITFIAAFLFWFFFFPNTAYLFTLVRHLVDHCTDYNIHRVCFEEAWKVPLFLFYALMGLPTFVYSLRMMQRVFSQWFGSGRFLPFFIIPLTALGILFGLFERFNTWDIVTHPLTLVEKTLSYLTQPWSLLDFFVYIFVLSAIYYGTLYLWKARTK